MKQSEKGCKVNLFFFNIYHIIWNLFKLNHKLKVMQLTIQQSKISNKKTRTDKGEGRVIGNLEYSPKVVLIWLNGYST